MTLALIPASVTATTALATPATGVASLVWLCVAVPLVTAGILLVAGKASDAWGHWLAIAAATVSFVVAAAVFFQLIGLPSDGRVLDVALYRWVPLAGAQAVNLAMRVDPLSVTFLLLVTFVGTLIHIYSVGYMKHDVARRRFFAYLNFFVASMLLLVLGDSYLVLFVGWEGVGLASYLLISFWNQVPENATAGKKAFLMNRVGDMGMLIAMMIMFSTLGTVTFQGVNAGIDRASTTTVTAIGIFLLVAACGKSAQFPLQAWLGDAMAGPTPVSALIHAATMVTAGVYLMVRSGAIYAVSSTAQLLVATIGTITLLFGAVVGCAKDDMKKVLAASTMSQIGYMMLAAGLGPVGAGFAIFHLVTHGFFKANMFLGAGSVMHAMNDEVDMRGFGGLRKYMPITWATFLCGYLAIIGFPFLSGYFSKDKIIETAFVGQGWQPWVFGTLALLVAGLTAFYMSRMFFMIFHGEERFSKKGKNAHHPHEAPASMYMPQVILAIGSLALGFVLNRVGFTAWLEPVTGGGEHGEPVIAPVAITVATLAVVAIGVGVAWKMYLASQVPVEVPVGSALTRAARNDLYQDVINETLVMKPGLAATGAVAVVDQHVVDGAVEGVARGTTATGRLLGRLQNGYVRSYAAYMYVGVVIALIIALASRF
ncbi:NADH-quinone oxidoreductase subunit L [Actinobaculum sp. 313]|uniref:NADH-quinone oxidoreductase subunit L n=1 Tax=Actinobaculum sp. 313 TaxID=2495645 RepID=UPI000D527BDD|nr:NADH-quinone oxidoreductase subunit L [Actinobaculum sp. 313]AWE42924.1 NADH-quinone oxidoreductase subunit L [Actinobaculum sp. 313]